MNTKNALLIFAATLMLQAGCASTTPARPDVGQVEALPDKPEKVVPAHLKQPPPAGNFLQNLLGFLSQKPSAPTKTTPTPNPATPL